MSGHSGVFTTIFGVILRKSSKMRSAMSIQCTTLAAGSCPRASENVQPVRVLAIAEIIPVIAEKISEHAYPIDRCRQQARSGR